MICFKAHKVTWLLLGMTLYLFLTGCFKTPIAYQCPQIILPNDPIPEVSKLSKNSSESEIVKSWVATAIQYKDWNEVVRRQMED